MISESHIDSVVRDAFAAEGFANENLRLDHFRRDGAIVSEVLYASCGLKNLSSVHPPLFCSYQLNPALRLSYNGNLHIRDPFCGKGYGAAFVHARERICTELGIDVINLCTNPGFWKHMGYGRLGLRPFFGEWKTRTGDMRAKGIYLSVSSRFKRLSVQ